MNSCLPTVDIDMDIDKLKVNFRSKQHSAADISDSPSITSSISDVGTDDGETIEDDDSINCSDLSNPTAAGGEVDSGEKHGECTGQETSQHDQYRITSDLAFERVKSNSRETLEEYLKKILDESPKKETPSQPVHEPRIRRKIDEGSYPNWTVDEDTLPRILRYTWKAKLKKLGKYLSHQGHHKKINITDPRGRTALHYAASWRCPRTLKLLLDTPGINVNVRDEHGKTPLFKAVEIGGREGLLVVQMLIKAGANPLIPCRDTRDVFVYTMHEFGDERLDLLTYLYNEGGIKEKYKYMPYTMSLLHLAIIAPKHVQIFGIVKMLVDEKQNVNAMEGGGRSPLMLAAMTQRTKVLKFLLNSGASIYHVDQKKKSVRSYVKPGTRCEQIILNYIATRSTDNFPVCEISSRESTTSPVETDDMEQIFLV